MFDLFKILEQPLDRLTNDQIISRLSRREMDSPVVSSSYCQCDLCNSPGFQPNILRHSRIWGAIYEAAL
jgi:hypothetical protein